MLTPRKWLVSFGLWIARLGGWKPEVRFECPHQVRPGIRSILAHVEEKFPDAKGEFKRREALRVIMNVLPELSEAEANLQIELAINAD